MDKELMHKIIANWTMFGFNYGTTWIERAFKSKGERMIEHLKNKFNEAHNIAGIYGSFFYFWTMLDEGNKQLLEEWVMDNYREY